jgi:hypothetical protein
MHRRAGLRMKGRVETTRKDKAVVRELVIAPRAKQGPTEIMSGEA